MLHYPHAKFCIYMYGESQRKLHLRCEPLLVHRMVSGWKTFKSTSKMEFRNPTDLPNAIEPIHFVQLYCVQKKDRDNIRCEVGTR